MTVHKLGWGLAIVLAGRLLTVWLRISHEERRQAEADFRWFSTLGFPDIQGRPHVRVATGQTFRSGNEPPRNQYVSGFLLATNRDGFTVFTLDLSTSTMSNTAVGTPEHNRVGFELLNLRREAASRLRNLRRPPEQVDFWR